MAAQLVLARRQVLLEPVLAQVWVLAQGPVPLVQAQAPAQALALVQALAQAQVLAQAQALAPVLVLLQLGLAQRQVVPQLVLAQG